MIGETVSRYRIVQELGSGGMGIVYEAEDTVLGRKVALKFLPASLMDDRSAAERFTAEARTASALNHPNIVTIYEIGSASIGHFIAMEYVDGQTLRSMVGKQQPIEWFVPLAQQIARALVVAHGAGIIHRDIKPDNVMVRPDGIIKLLDFGLARLIPTNQSASQTETIRSRPGTRTGTFRYMSPEQAGAEYLTSATDIFSLGVVFYELVSGIHPFTADPDTPVLTAILSLSPPPLAHYNPDVPADLEDLILRMLEKQPRMRPAATEVEARLMELGADRVPEKASPQALPAKHIVGRAEEKGLLRAEFEKADAGRGAILCVSGEPGIGKTSLVDEFIAELGSGASPVIVARGRCSERLGESEAYLTLLDAIESLLRADRSDRIRSRLKLLAPDWYAQMMPAGNETPSLTDAGTSPERIKRQFCSFFQEISRTRTCILYLDDMHWADLSTTDIVAYLATKIASMRLLVVATYRPTDLLLSGHPFQRVLKDLLARGEAREIALNFLSRTDIDEYLANEFPGHSFPAEFATMIHARTEGSPLFVVDLIRYLVDRQIISHDGGPATLADPLDTIERELPQSVRSMIGRKIDQLLEHERRLLFAASVQGQEFDTAALARALQIDPGEVEESLERLEHVHAFVRMIEERELPNGALTRRYRFVHILYQAALYGLLTPSRRASLNRAVADALVEQNGAQTAAIAAELALLYEAARDFDKSSSYLLIAAQNAVRVLGYQEAISLARRGIEMVRRLPETPEIMQRELMLRVALGVPLTATSGYGVPEVEQTFSRANELAEKVQAGAPTLPAITGIGAFYLMRARVQEAREKAFQVLGLAESMNDRLLTSWGCWVVGIILSHAGELRDADRYLERCLELYQPDPLYFTYWGVDPGVAGHAQLARVQWLRGYPDRAHRSVSAAVELGERLTHPHSLAMGLFFGAWVHQLRRDVRRTQKLASAAISICAGHGFRMIEAWAKSLAGWATAEQGDTAAGIEMLRASLAEQRQIGVEIIRPHFLGLLAALHMRSGRNDEARDLVDQALDMVKVTGDRYYEPELHRLSGELCLAGPVSGGETAAAEDRFRRALETARSQDSRSLELRAAASLGRVLAKTGRLEEARELVIPTFQWFSEGWETADLREARALIETLRQ